MSEINPNEDYEAIDLDIQLDASQIESIPIDKTLTHPDEAAEAKATGEALATKTSIAEVGSTFTVNDQGFNAQHNITLTAKEIEMSDTDDTTVYEAVTELQETAQELGQKTAEDIPMGSEDETTIKEAIEDVISDLSEAAGRTGSDIPYKDGVNVKIAAVVDDAVERITTLEGKTGADILINGDEEQQQTIEGAIAAVDAKDADAIYMDADEHSETIYAAIQNLDGSKVDSSDIINDVVTGGIDKVLSAQQGVTLKGMIDAVSAAKLDNERFVTPTNLRSYSEWQSGMTTLQLIAALPDKCLFETVLQGGDPAELSDFDTRQDKIGTLIVFKMSSSYACAIMAPKKSGDTFWYFIMTAADSGRWYKHSMVDAGFAKTVNEIAADENGNIDLGYVTNEEIDAMFEDA